MADIDRIAREGAGLAGKATPPPWTFREDAKGIEGDAAIVAPDDRDVFTSGPFWSYADGYLTAHAGTHYAALCRAVIERGEELAALRARVAELEGRGAKPWQPREGRCDVCDWTLAESRDKGCVPGDCAYRPTEGTDEWLRIKARRVEVERQRVEHAKGGAA